MHRNNILRTCVTSAVGIIAINLLFLAPHWLLNQQIGAPWLALESVWVSALMIILTKARKNSALTTIGASIILTLSFLIFFDEMARQSLGRPLNLYLDLQLGNAVYNLMTGSLGVSVTVMVLGGCVLMIPLIVWSLGNLLALPSQSFGRTRRFQILSAIILLLLPIAAVQYAPLSRHTVLSLPAFYLVRDQYQHFVRMMAEQNTFIEEIKANPTYVAYPTTVLNQLKQSDVLFAFLESYGMSTLTDPRYSQIIKPRLKDFAKRAKNAGLHVATGMLEAPTQGGQSWFSHLSILSGLWIDNQLRYDLLLANGPDTLINDFRRTGHRTVALMPANTMPWPEGQLLGYDYIIGRNEIDYAGPPLNWVTMPDQFIWSFLENSIRHSTDDPRPLFAEISLISSHAPWTPILPVLDDWEIIGNGEIFEPWRNAGEKPEQLWLDYERVREHFSLAIDYALNVMTSYAERFVDKDTLLVVLGDHEPAPLITGDSNSRAVPVHVISEDPALIQPFLDLGYISGTFPNAQQSAPTMDVFRNQFIRAFSEGPSPKVSLLTKD